MTIASIRVAVLGGGAIAHSVAEASIGGAMPGVVFVGVGGKTTPPSSRVSNVASLLGVEAAPIEDLMRYKPQWVLEAAGVEAARVLVPKLMREQVGIIVMSVGAFADDAFSSAVAAYRATGGRVIVPAGAIGGLDVIRALNALGGLLDAEITTTKAPEAFAGAPYVIERGIEVPPDRTVTVFHGSAREAIKGFPANVNVAIALSLVGVGLDRTIVTLIADPDANSTRHVIRAEGRSADVTIEVSSHPHLLNPKTSQLAALSAIAVLRQIASGEVA